MECIRTSSLLFLFVSFPSLSLGCTATSASSAAVVATTEATVTVPTTSEPTSTTPSTTTMMPCNPASVAFGTSNGMDQIDVLYSYFADDDLMMATMTVRCTADDNSFSTMSMYEGGSQFTPPGGDGTMQTSSVTLSCSYDTMVWIFSVVIGGQTYTNTIDAVECTQA